MSFSRCSVLKWVYNKNWLIHSLFSIPLTLDMLTFRLDEVPIYSNVQKNKHILKSVQFVCRFFVGF